MPRYLFYAALSFAVTVLASWSVATGEDSLTTSDGQVRHSQLVQLGLGTMDILSDADGNQIRGQFIAMGEPGSGFFLTDVNPNALLHNKNSKGMPGRVVHHSSLSKSAVLLYHPQVDGMKVTGKK